ncbi:MAG: ABC transporter substrate-binding protein, partial [Rhodospirillales bacterium]|nr:ABC transporter substrate-binding protein [Rhodospirillales bacterium]
LNKKMWDGLSKTHQTIIEQACASENNRSFAEFNARNGGALQTLRTKHGVQLKEMPRDVLQAIGEASGQVVAEAGKSDAMTKKVYDSFYAFRKQAIAWSKLSDQAYWNARLLPFKY